MCATRGGPLWISRSPSVPAWQAMSSLTQGSPETLDSTRARRTPFEALGPDRRGSCQSHGFFDGRRRLQSCPHGQGSRRRAWARSSRSSWLSPRTPGSKIQRNSGWPGTGAGTETPRRCAVGRHVALFYERKENLLELCVPFLKAGLERTEVCVWVIAEPLTERDAWAALGAAVSPHDL